LQDRLDGLDAYDCVVGAVAHDDYAAFSNEALTAMVGSGGLVVDLKGMWRSLDLGPDVNRMEI
jgi:UDP-N-acetyl-D-mannosaminuronate dehydrogenase